jgi:hypothetical protein
MDSGIHGAIILSSKLIDRPVLEKHIQLRLATQQPAAA